MITREMNHRYLTVKLNYAIAIRPSLLAAGATRQIAREVSHSTPKDTASNGAASSRTSSAPRHASALIVGWCSA